MTTVVPGSARTPLTPPALALRALCEATCQRLWAVTWRAGITELAWLLATEPVGTVAVDGLGDDEPATLLLDPLALEALDDLFGSCGHLLVQRHSRSPLFTESSADRGQHTSIRRRVQVKMYENL